MTQLTDSVYAVEVPDESKWHQVVHISPSIEVLHYYIQGGYIENKSAGIDLPPGTWQILCMTREVTEEVAKGIVEYDKFIDGYKDYDTDNFHHDTPFIKAVDSLRSLITSKGLDGRKNYCLLEKM